MNAIFEDGSVFQATICDQILSRNLNEELQIIFTVQITAKATTDPGSSVGMEPMEPFERDVYLTLSEDGQKLNIARENLKRLGVEGVDIIKFHPDHPEFVSLLDKEVQVRCRIKGDSTYWNFSWTSFRPPAISLKEAEAAARQFQQRLDGNAACDGNLEVPLDGHNPPVSY